MIEARSARDRGECPSCGAGSTRVHGRYQRRLADTALAGRPVVIRLLVRRLVCREAGCARVTVVEQIPGLTRPHSRYNPPLRAASTAIAVALAGRPGARLARKLGMHVGRDTLLDRILGRLGSQDHQLRLYPGLGHSLGIAPTVWQDQLLPIQPQPLNDLVAWLRVHQR